MEPNPYEAPKAGERGKPSQVVKRWMGVVTILLLTPVVVAVAFGASCAATFAISGSSIAQDWLAVWAPFLIPPAVVLAAMYWWAVRQHRHNRQAALHKEKSGQGRPRPKSS